jgi:DNA primase
MAQTGNWKVFLYARGINDESIERYGLSGEENRVIIPVRDKNGTHLFNKYRLIKPKRYLYDDGSTASIFGLEFAKKEWVVLCEGELDAVRLSQEGIPAISGTGGCGTFKKEWVNDLPKFVFICYDTDEAGKEASKKIHHMIPNSRIVELTDGKDITDYLMNHSREDFKELMKQSKVYPRPLKELSFARTVGGTDLEKAKSYPIEKLIEFRQRKAKCIWHNEKSGSLHLYKDNHVYCFGCSRGGDAIDVYQTLNNASFEEAVNYLSNH